MPGDILPLEFLDNIGQTVTRRIDGRIIRRLAWDPESTRVVVANESRIELIDVKTSRSIWASDQDQVLSVCWSPDASKIAAAGFDGCEVLQQMVDAVPMLKICA